MFLVISLAAALVGYASADDGTATFPLSRWEEMLDAADRAAVRPIAPVPALQVDRSIEGSFQRGVFTGTLITRLRVPPGHEAERFPILDASASISAVTLDG